MSLSLYPSQAHLVAVGNDAVNVGLQRANVQAQTHVEQLCLDPLKQAGQLAGRLLVPAIA